MPSQKIKACTEISAWTIVFCLEQTTKSIIGGINLKRHWYIHVYLDKVRAVYSLWHNLGYCLLLFFILEL